MTRVLRWIGDHPLSDWRWPASSAVALFAACVVIALLNVWVTSSALTGRIRDRGEQSLCQQKVEGEFEKAVGHALTVDRTSVADTNAVRAEITVAVAKLEKVDELCPTK